MTRQTNCCTYPHEQYTIECTNCDKTCRILRLTQTTFIDRYIASSGWTDSEFPHLQDAAVCIYQIPSGCVPWIQFDAMGMRRRLNEMVESSRKARPSPTPDALELIDHDQEMIRLHTDSLLVKCRPLVDSPRERTTRAAFAFAQNYTANPAVIE